MNNKYIMSLDQGTTSSRCVIYDRQGEARSMAQREFRQIYPFPGWVEHDPMEIWGTQAGAAAEAMAKAGLSPDDMAAIGITNQRETVVLWDKENGVPVCNAIVWQCRRTADYCLDLKERGFEPIIKAKTGLVLDAYFSATKIKWALDNIPRARALADNGNLLFGTVDSWLIWNLTKGRVHATDRTNASRTMLYNIHTLDWDEDLLKLFGIPRQILPEVRPSGTFFGNADKSVFAGEIPIMAAAGDQQAALFGQMCNEEGTGKNTYGTGCFLLMNTGSQAVSSENGMITTLAATALNEPQYALEGSIFVGGSVVQWLRDELGIVTAAEESEAMARKVTDTGGVYFVPAFVGLGAPYWNPYARGVIFGLTRGTKKEQVVRAALESMAYQTCDVIRAMEADAGMKLKYLKADGGAAGNGFLMQFQSDILGIPVIKAKTNEVTALGVACLAGLTSGYWENLNKAALNISSGDHFNPSISVNERESRLSSWRKAVDAAIYLSGL